MLAHSTAGLRLTIKDQRWLIAFLVRSGELQLALHSRLFPKQEGKMDAADRIWSWLVVSPQYGFWCRRLHLLAGYDLWGRGCDD